MTITASGTVVNRTQRIRAAGASLSLAYLRNSAEGDRARASIVLAEFQSFWNQYRTSIQAPGGTRLPGTVQITGYFDEAGQTQWALLYVLVIGAVVPNDSTSTLTHGATAMTSWYQAQVVSRVAPNSPLWAAYQVTREAPTHDAGGAAGAWAFAFIEGIDEEPNLIDILADEGRVQVPPAPSPGTGTDYGVMDPIDIFAVPLRRKTWTWWPWALAAVGGGLLYAGFVYKRKGRR